MIKVRPSRATFLLPLVILLLLISACGNASISLSYTPPFAPVTFTIDTNGNISIQGDTSITTLIGTFALAANVSATLQVEDDALYVVIRHSEKNGVVDTVYKIQTGQDEVNVVTNGTITIDVTLHKVFIDASKGTIKSIELKGANIASPTSPSTNPSPGTNVLVQDPLKNIQTIYDPSQYCYSQSDGYHDNSGGVCFYSNQEFGNVSISVTTELIQGDLADDPGEYGLVFRGNGYTFAITGNGHWFYQLGPGIPYQEETYNSAIKQGLGAINILQVSMKGSHFDFFVNGIKVGEMNDSTDSNGTIGFLASGNVEAVFSNLLITKLPK